MDDGGSSFAALMIFVVVALLQIVPTYLERQMKHGGGKSEEEKKLHAEIKRILKEADTLSQPSTFAEAAKLRRNAAAKEKELVKYKEKQMAERKSLYGPYMKYVTPLKALAYLLLAAWFWKSPVAAISEELVQPFGKILSWKSGASSMDKVTVGVVPWLVLCTRVSKLIGRKCM